MRLLQPSFTPTKAPTPVPTRAPTIPFPTAVPTPAPTYTTGLSYTSYTAFSYQSQLYAYTLTAQFYSCSGTAVTLTYASTPVDLYIRNASGYQVSDCYAGYGSGVCSYATPASSWCQIYTVQQQCISYPSCNGTVTLSGVIAEIEAQADIYLSVSGSTATSTSFYGETGGSVSYVLQGPPYPCSGTFVATVTFASGAVAKSFSPMTCSSEYVSFVYTFTQPSQTYTLTLQCQGSCNGQFAVTVLDPSPPQVCTP